MPTSSAQHQARIDTLMEQASKDLVRRKYFDAEARCVEALRRAHATRDYDRLARILLPLQEARRQKRDMALDAAQVFLCSAELPTGRDLRPGCYLVSPPRVGVDGRNLRNAADEKRIPVMVIVREPSTREGLWPIVAVGPATVRTKVSAPVAAPPPKRRRPAPAKTPAKPPVKKATKDAPAPPPAAGAPETITPTPEWFIAASEALGDAAIAQVSPDAHPTMRVDRLLALLEAHPDHEKLHQRLEEAARAAARDPRPQRRPSPLLDDYEGEDNADL